MKRGDDPLLEHRPEVDEQVPATDEVELRERRILRHVLAREHAHVAHGFADLKAAAVLDEKPPPPRHRHNRRDARRVDAGPRFVDRRLANVRGENLHRHARALVAEKLQERDDDRIGLLARRAARHPDANRRLRRTVLEQPGKNFFLQRLEHLRLAEEARHVDEQVLVERVHLVGRLLEEAHVGRERLDLVQHHPPRDAALERRRLVEGKIHARRRAQQDEDFVQVLVALRFRRRRERDIGLPPEPRQLPRDALRRQHEIHHPRRDGAVRHAVVFRGLFILRKRQSALGLDDAQPLGAVRRRAGKDDADGAALLVGGERAEKEIHRQMLPARLRARHETQPPVQHCEVRIRRDDIDVIGLDAHPIARFVNRERGGAREQRRQHALVLRVEVLHEHEGQPGVQRQRAEQLRERLQPARRRADADDGEGLALGARSFRAQGGGGGLKFSRGCALHLPGGGLSRNCFFQSHASG